MLPWHIVEEICISNDVILTLMHSSNLEHVTFFMKKKPYDNKIYGVCHGTIITFGIQNRVEFDLNDPNSILKMNEYLSSAEWL